LVGEFGNSNITESRIIFVLTKLGFETDAAVLL